MFPENTLKFGRCKKNKVSQLIFTYGKVSLSLLTCAQSESQLIQSVCYLMRLKVEMFYISSGHSYVSMCCRHSRSLENTCVCVCVFNFSHTVTLY